MGIPPQLDFNDSYMNIHKVKKTFEWLIGKWELMNARPYTDSLKFSCC